MAFLNNRTSFYFVIGLISLAAIGIISSFISNPTDFLQSIFVFIAVGAIIYFLVRRFYKAGPQKKEQQAFRKAAKRSKKRFVQKDTQKTPTRIGTLSKLKKQNTKKDTSHLTVIEGKKGKKKNRASF
ncbi:SA1362 family protein [Cytobacillus sp. FJAT-54145]|uniref:SA1362 family protein n=1 Tax=Cytobacillus spartinae TaxID=3299023 RepID=A0ABW6KE24_9BACI